MANHKQYFYGLLAKYVSFHLPESARVAELAPRSWLMREALERPVAALETAGPDEGLDQLVPGSVNRLLMVGTLQFDGDAQQLLERVHARCDADTRLVIVYFSSLWKPLFSWAARLGLSASPPQNWLSPSDVANLLALSEFELVAESKRILLPVYIPLLSALLNRWLAPLPLLRHLTLANIAVARPRVPVPASALSVSVVVAARNERGNIESLVRRLPKMGPDDELIFVEGHSSDGTWEEVCRMPALFPELNIRCYQQTGRGKGDAVRLGFAESRKDVLMILDADLSVPPEMLPRFYRALVTDVGEFINGSRLVYPMEERAMRFFNVLGNKFFAAAFSFLLGQPLKDTLCGTKVLRRRHYEAIAADRQYFGDFDPFGDFDLLFGAARQALRIVELPIHYRERVYGETNIHRWSHGWLLLRMTVFAARRIKFL